MNFAFDTPLIAILCSLLVLWVWGKRRELKRLPRSERWAVTLRTAALTLLILALAGPRLAQSAADRYLYFLIDRSASTQLGTTEGELKAALQKLAPPAPQTEYALITFGAEPLIESGFAPTITLGEFQTEPRLDATNIESAIGLALETLPAKGRREIVLLSDGRATAGNLDRALARARRENVPVHVWPLAMTKDLTEAWLDALQVPDEAAPKLPFVILLRLGATQPTTVTILVYRNEELRQTFSVSLVAGVQELRLTDKIDSAGTYHYRVYLKPERDQIAENNQREAAVTVPGSAPLLLVEPQSRSGSPLARLLQNTNFDFDQMTLHEFLANPLVLSHYKAVILNNVPLGKIPAQKYKMLKRYVGDLDGGLLIVQGREAVEGLSEQTPEELAQLEELLPVSYLVPEPYQIPGLALLFLLDRSGSMADSVRGGIPKLEILKRSALRSLEILDQDDWVGLMAFDTEFQWVVPLQPLGDRQPFRENIQRLSASGGTDIYFALKEAFDILEKTSARIKHILVFSDGHNNNKREREYRELYARLEKSAVRISALGIDQTPDEEFLQGLASAGRGKYQRVQEFTDLPVFSLREVRRIARLRWIEGRSPVAANAFHLNDLPALQGYVLTHAKPAARIAIATSPENDPVLSFWSYGLGRVGVLNTDLEGSGSAEWLSWPELSKLVGESIAQIYRPKLQEELLKIQTNVTEEHLEIIADAQDERGQWASGLNLRATLSGPVHQEISFDQIAPGRYRARLERPASGLYGLKVTAQRGETIAARTRSLVVPYSEEYRRLGTDTEALDKIARATGGQFLERPHLPPLSALSRDAYQELWPWALWLALGFFIADLAARKLLWLLER